MDGQAKTALLLTAAALAAAYLLFYQVLLQVNGLYAGDVESLDMGEEPLKIQVNRWVEFDFMKKSEILELRRQEVFAQKEIAPEGYKPCDHVFGQIQDGKPWWGTLGLSYFGPGEKGIEGPSYHSFHILNPYLLVGLGEGNAVIVNDRRLKPKPVFQELKSLTWSREGKLAQAVYNISEYERLRRIYHHPRTGLTSLYAYNARDMGYEYMYVDVEESVNVIWFGDHRIYGVVPWPQGPPAKIRHFFHLGTSCGYEGGCNNISPHTPKLKIRLGGYPARAHIKLWNKKPDNPQQKADMTYILDITR